MPIMHRLLILSCLALWCAFPAEGKSKPARKKGPPMTQRILFHPAPTVEWLKGLQVETLGKIPKGTWLAADDAAAMELVRRDKTTLAIYPSRAAYDEAMDGLKDSEVAEAMNLRLAIVQGNQETESVPDFFLLERKGLEAIAVAAMESGTTGSFDAAFRAQLDVLLSINGPESYRGHDNISLLDGMFEDLNKLNWEEEALRRHPGVSLPDLEPSLDRKRKDLALEIQRGERKLGVKADHEPSGRVFDRLERGVFAKPFDEGLVQGISEGHEPVHRWKDGFVSIWAEFELQNIPMKDKEKTILYFDADQCHGEFMRLTKSQLNGRFLRQSRRSKTEDAGAYLARLRLSVVFELLGRRPLVAKFNPDLAEAFGQLAEMEFASLKTFLASQKPWRGKTSTPRLSLREELQSTSNEVDFWRAWGAAKFWSYTQDRAEWISAAKQRVVSHLPKDK